MELSLNNIDNRIDKCRFLELSNLNISNLNNSKNSDIVEFIMLGFCVDIQLFVIENYKANSKVLINNIDSVSSFINFVNDKFALSAMKSHKEHNGKKFDELPPFLQNKVYSQIFIINRITNYGDDNESINIISEIINNIIK